MRNKISLVFITLLLFSCTTNSNSKKNQEVKKSEISFMEFSKKLPEIDVPLSSSCDIELEGSSFGFTNEEIERFGIANTTILGKLADTEKYTAIIYLYAGDVVFPIIQTTDKNGNKISELKLNDGYCGEDESSMEFLSFKIEKDLTIQLTGSVTTFERDENGEILEATKKTIVNHSHFFINEDGKILTRK